jgi:hypothetical protein
MSSRKRVSATVGAACTRIVASMPRRAMTAKICGEEVAMEWRPARA